MCACVCVCVCVHVRERGPGDEPSALGGGGLPTVTCLGAWGTQSAQQLTDQILLVSFCLAPLDQAALCVGKGKGGGAPVFQGYFFPGLSRD